MKFGIIAPGNVARSMAKAVSGIEGIEKYAVASRSLGRAEDFAKEWGFEKAYGSYEELAADPEAEFIYVASPHSHHYEHARLCIEQGKHVLVEKAFTVNVQQAQALMELAKEKDVLVAEAMWTRYLPVRKMITDLLDGGAIGNVRSMTANLGAPLAHVERMARPELAGGALLDLSVYPITMALMLFREKIADIGSMAVMSPEGVDWRNSITLTFADGKMASLTSDMTAVTDSRAIINGDRGFLEIWGITNPSAVLLYDTKREQRESIPVPEQINGYEYEVLACMRALREGKRECEEMPHSETLRVMRLLDEIRAHWGMSFPCEAL